MDLGYATIHWDRLEATRQRIPVLNRMHTWLPRAFALLHHSDDHDHSDDYGDDNKSNNHPNNKSPNYSLYGSLFFAGFALGFRFG